MPKESYTLAEVREMCFGSYLMGVARRVPEDPPVEDRPKLVAALREEFYGVWEDRVALKGDKAR